MTEVEIMGETVKAPYYGYRVLTEKPIHVHPHFLHIIMSNLVILCSIPLSLIVQVEFTTIQYLLRRHWPML